MGVVLRMAGVACVAVRAFVGARGFVLILRGSNFCLRGSVAVWAPAAGKVLQVATRRSRRADEGTQAGARTPLTHSPTPNAQVYRGRLLTGEEVAVKVQRPGIGESIAVDMLLLRRLMAVVDRHITPTIGVSGGAHGAGVPLEWSAHRAGWPWGGDFEGWCF